MNKIEVRRDQIVNICCPDGAKEFVRETVASILLNLVEGLPQADNKQSTPLCDHAECELHRVAVGELNKPCLFKVQ